MHSNTQYLYRKNNSYNGRNLNSEANQQGRLLMLSSEVGNFEQELSTLQNNIQSRFPQDNLQVYRGQMPSYDAIQQQERNRMGWFNYSGHYNQELAQNIEIALLENKMTLLKTQAMNVLSHIESKQIINPVRVGYSSQDLNDKQWHDFGNGGFGSQRDQNARMTSIEMDLLMLKDNFGRTTQALFDILSRDNPINIERVRDLLACSLYPDQKFNNISCLELSLNKPNSRNKTLGSRLA